MRNNSTREKFFNRGGNTVVVVVERDEVGKFFYFVGRVAHSDTETRRLQNFRVVVRVADCNRFRNVESKKFTQLNKSGSFGNVRGRHFQIKRLGKTNRQVQRLNSRKISVAGFFAAVIQIDFDDFAGVFADIFLEVVATHANPIEHPMPKFSMC